MFLLFEARAVAPPLRLTTQSVSCAPPPTPHPHPPKPATATNPPLLHIANTQKQQQTPNSLIQRGRVEEGRNALRDLRGPLAPTSKVQSEFERILTAAGGDASQQGGKVRGRSCCACVCVCARLCLCVFWGAPQR